MNRKVLLVSPYPYSISSRGMDVLTTCFSDEGWDVSHLTYPRAFYTPRIERPDNSVKVLTPPKSLFPYIDRIMFWFPKLFFNIVKWINNLSVRRVDFSSYDYIVLESGKALFLMDVIPDNIPIIYRLSDSVQLVLGKNPHYHDLEKKVFEISNRMVFKKGVYKDSLKEHQKDKTVVIENGMAIPKGDLGENPYQDNSRNAVYVGLHQLDYPTVESILKNTPECNFHIIGPCLGKSQVKKLNQYENFHYYSFLSKEEYMPMLKWADFAIFPFKRTESMKWFGLTSKLLHFMFFDLPIVLYPTGIEGEFDGLEVTFADSVQDFTAKVKEVVDRGRKIKYNLDFNFYSSDSRDEEYKRFIRSL